MNMRSIATLMVLALCASFAGAETLEKYLVATRSRPSPSLTGALEKGSARVKVFRSVDGFAATLTTSEADDLRRHPDVLFVEKDPPRFLFIDALPDNSFDLTAVAEAGEQVVPYGVDLIHATAIRKLTRGAGVDIGIVDTGIDLAHRDLAPNIGGGMSFLPGIPSFADDGGHGTHVAGTAGAVDNGFGVVGVAPDARLFSLRVFKGSGTNDDDFANASAVIEVIDWAIANRIEVLNMSFGGPESSLLEAQSLQKAQDNGIFVAVAVGNTGNLVPQFPAAYPGAFGVGSVDRNGVIAPSSTRGSFVDVVAPGVGVRSTVPENRARSMTLTDSTLGTIEASILLFSPRGALQGEWVACGIGRPEDFPSNVAGRIALIQRGELPFAEKAKNAKAAGAVAVVIYNNESGPFNGQLADDGFEYPVTVGISKEDGEALLAAGATTFVSSTLEPYGFDSGTSMASPHVAGAAALLRALVPEASSVEIENALRATARDLGDPGYDTVYGHGLIDVEAAAKLLAPERFATRQRPVRR